MIKASRILQTIIFILAGALLALLIFLLSISIRDTREANKRLDGAELRIRNLEQDQQNIKEALDAHGFEDLNL